MNPSHRDDNSLICSEIHHLSMISLKKKWRYKVTYYKRLSIAVSENMLIFEAEIKGFAIMIGTLKASDVYMDLLETLPDDEKLDLISKLVKSMKKAVAVKRSRRTSSPASLVTGWGYGHRRLRRYAS